MEENLLIDQTLTMSLTDPEGKVTATTQVSYAEILAFRKSSGAPISALLDNMFNGLNNVALYGPEGKSPSNNLPPRKPGQDQRN